MRLHPDMIVTIYLDPLTGEHPEGEAVLIECLESSGPGNPLERWRVRFSDGVIVERKISPILHSDKLMPDSMEPDFDAQELQQQREAIFAAAAHLRTTDRGRKALESIWHFFEEGGMSLDEDNQQAVLMLMSAGMGHFQGTVREALDEN